MDDYREQQRERWRAQKASPAAANTVNTPASAPLPASQQQAYQPLPNPWAQAPPSSSSAAVGGPTSFVRQSAPGSAHVVDLGYTTIAVTPEEMQARPARTSALLCCCPCLLGDPCSQQHINDLKKAARTFIVMVTVADILVFLGELALGAASPQGDTFLAPPGCVLATLGAVYAPAIVNRGQVWRLVAPIFLHGGLLHIACNVYVQLLVGLRCEAEWGFATTAVVYAVCGVGGNLASAAMSPFTMAVGASGAIVGLVGTRAAQLVAEWDSYPPAERSAQAWQVATTLFLLTAFGGASAVGEGVPGLPRVDNYAHGGGLAFGLLCGFALFGAQPGLCCCAPQLPAQLLEPANSSGQDGSGEAAAGGGGAGAFGGTYSSAAASASVNGSERHWAGGFVDASSGLQRSPLSKLFAGLQHASNLQKIALGLLVVSSVLLVLLLMATPPTSGYLARC